MRRLLLLFPLLTACGPNVATIAGDDEPPSPTTATQRVEQVARPATTLEVRPVVGVWTGQPMPPQMALTVAPRLLEVSAAPMEFVDAGVVDAGVVDAGTVDAGVEVDAGALVDAGAPVDAGVSPEDAGSTIVVSDGGVRGLEVSPHLALGLPDDSSVGRAQRWLLVRPQFVSSYDTTKKVPNWTSWTLAAADLGQASRATTFRTDPLLPTGTPQAVDGDYRLSGFDRGHLCPSADRTATDADNDATFYLTNVVPQTHASNAGPWLDLEDEARVLATSGHRLVILAGPIFGVTTQTIGSGVAVPLALFKVAVVMDATGTINANTRVYAAIVPNSTVVSGAWRQFQVTARTVEQQTGLDVLSDLPRATQDVLENRLDP